MLHQLKNPHLYFMILGEVALFIAAYFLAYLIRFEFSLGPKELKQLFLALPWFVLLKMIVFFSMDLYRGMWRYTGIRDFWRLGLACLFAMLLGLAAVALFFPKMGYSRAVFLIDSGLTFLLSGTLRLSIRSFFQFWPRRNSAGIHHDRPHHRKSVLIIGAGAAGEKILREIIENEGLNYHVKGFIDDDPIKLGRSIHGVKVMGRVEQLPDLLDDEDIEEILIAVPSVQGEKMRRIVNVCKECNVPYKTLPGIGEIIDGRVSIKNLRDVSYEDLLGRPPVHLDETGIRECLQDHVIMITGCGGSIGSELCRQVIRFKPQRLILVDAGEENLFNIQMELQNELNFHDYHPLLADIKDRALMKSVFNKYRPSIIFHAAAYKHVPMLERNPWEAVFNNIQGSRVLMEMAIEHNVQRFVLVSTDKAVRPTNVMGASKRVAELLLQSFRKNGSGTLFMAVRFGNVVGSSGSVIPLFRRQIEQGGPVTVTHPEVTRYFMTIPEAAQLIIQAGAMGQGGEIFILEMGTPVRIAEMAKDLIRLSGREPEKDIRIIYTGLREGEKLYEELITSGEGIVETVHKKIMVLKADGIWNGSHDVERFIKWLHAGLNELYGYAEQHDAKAIKSCLVKMIPEYTPQDTDGVL
jgi:FlaA1/EpsC-like NDP-sugar epimerase